MKSAEIILQENYPTYKDELSKDQQLKINEAINQALIEGMKEANRMLDKSFNINQNQED